MKIVMKDAGAYAEPRRQLDTFINPLVYTFWGNHGPSIMTMTAALADGGT
jgi:hypothetical protein